MFGLKATLITGAVGLAATLVLAFLWKSEQVKVARLETEVKAIEGELDLSQENNNLLKGEIAEQKDDFDRVLSMMEKNAEKINELEQERDNARLETAKTISEINSLRAAETQRAIAAPFQRGNLAHERLTNSLRRIAGKTSGTDTGGEHSSIATAGEN